jgi:hypothetical protein
MRTLPFWKLQLRAFVVPKNVKDKCKSIDPLFPLFQAFAKQLQGSQA